MASFTCLMPTEYLHILHKKFTNNNLILKNNWSLLINLVVEITEKYLPINVNIIIYYNSTR